MRGKCDEPVNDQLCSEAGTDFYYSTRVPGFKVRPAMASDVPLILDFIRRLADYERLADQVVATEEVLRDSLFVKRQAEVLIGELDGKPVAFALFFYNFSTFLGKANLYLEDLFVDEGCRGLGLGRIMFSCLARIAVERGCDRLDWWCLDWNEPSIAFYKGMGAVPMSDWTVYRLEGDRLRRMAGLL